MTAIKPPYPAGTSCRYKHRTDLLAQCWGEDLVVKVVRAHPRLGAMVEVVGSNGYKTWVSWVDLYPLVAQQ